MHVDGAFGLWACAAPGLAALTAGIAEADSWAADAHKWLQVPYDCGLAVVRDAGALSRAMSITASYLPRGENRAPEAFSPEMSRRARGFAVWAVLKALGREGVAEMVERHCAVARHVAGRLKAEPGLAVLNEVVLNQVALACGDGAGGGPADQGDARGGAGGRGLLPEPRALAGPGDHPGVGLGGADDGRGRDADGGGDHRGVAAGARGVSGAAVIEARGLGLTFQTADGPVHALKEVNLSVGKGDFVSFIGPSGCGKTTFLRVAADLETPTAGTITVNGMSPAEAREARAYGYVFQAAGLFPWRTIGGNVRLPLEIMGYGRAERRQRMARVLELVELGGFEKKYPWQLSGGMQQRASIARALAFDADILLMDEPFGALDEIVRDRLNEELLGLWARTEKTICFVTHSIPEAVYLSTRIVVMSPRPGRVTDVIESPLPRERPLHIRESREFLEIAARVRDGLRAGVGEEV